MPLPTFSEWPDIPSRSAPEADFDAKMYAVFQFMAGTYRDEFLAFAAFLEANSTVVGGALNATTIGLTSPAAGKFTTLLADSLGGAAVQASLTDTTAERLLKVGAFGLGQGGASPEMVNANSAPAGGFYMVNDLATATNWPVALASGPGWLIVVPSQNANNRMQICGGLNAGQGIYARKYRSGIWRDWVLVYSQESILGAVSQVAGVPTGGLIERGTNANGEYARFADGTQLCWYRLSLGSILSAGSGTFADPYRSAPIGWTFPAVFIANPVVSGIAETTNSADHTGRANYVRCGAPGSTSVTAVQAFRASASNIDMTVDANLMAIGRWF